MYSKFWFYCNKEPFKGIGEEITKVWRYIVVRKELLCGEVVYLSDFYYKFLSFRKYQKPPGVQETIKIQTTSIRISTDKTRFKTILIVQCDEKKVLKFLKKRFSIQI